MVMLRRLGRDVAIYGLADFIFRLVGFAVFPIYAHVFSLMEFGIYALVTAAVGVFALFANLGLNNAAQRYYLDTDATAADQPVVVSTGLVFLLFWSSAIVGVAVAVLYPLADWIHSRYGIAWSIIVLALLAVIPEQLTQYCLDTLRLHFAPWKFACVSFLKNILGVGAGLVLILGFDTGLQGLFAGALIGAVSAVPIAVYFIRKDLVVRFDAGLARRLAAFGYPFIFVGLAYWLFGTVDRWMLAELSSPQQVGLYAIAYKFASVIVFINSAFGQAWSPLALRIRRDDGANYRTTYARVFSVWLYVLVVIGSLVAFFGREVLQLLTPKEYWDAAEVLAVLTMGIVLSGTTQITAVGISLERKTRLFALAAWTTALANVALNLAFIPSWGAVGAAWATFVCYGLLTSLYLFWSQQLHPIPLERSRLLFLSGLVIMVVIGAPLLARMDVSLPGVLIKVAIVCMFLLSGMLVVSTSALRAAFGEMRRA